MIMFIGIVFTVITLVLFGIIMAQSDTFQWGALFGLMFTATTITAIITFVVATSPCSISPMDVYRGKTTLEYKVIDGVKVDSTVVWKEEME